MEKLTHRVRALLERGERITRDDCHALFEVRDLNLMSGLSRIARERRFGKRARFVAATRVEVDASLPIEETLAPYAERSEDLLLVPAATTPPSEIEAWGAHVSEAISLTGPRRVTARLDPVALREIYTDSSRLRSVIDTLGGTEAVTLSAAHAFADDPLWSDAALSMEHWIATQQAAAELGLRADAGAVYHDAADLDTLADQFDRLRTLQDATGHFRSFVPLPFTSAAFESEPHRRSPGAAMTLRVGAIARIFFDNIEHIATPLRLVAPETSFVALSYGTDLIDPLYMASDAEPEGPQEGGLDLAVVAAAESREEDILRFIEERIVETRFRPVPVDAHYRELALKEVAR